MDQKKLLELHWDKLSPMGLSKEMISLSLPSYGLVITMTLSLPSYKLSSKLLSTNIHLRYENRGIDLMITLFMAYRTMGLEYLDNYLVHWPIKLKPGVNEPIPKEDEFEKDLGIEETWQGMERCLEMGLCKSIGVSNFSSKKIFDLLDFASVSPSVNQVCIQHYHQDFLLRKFKKLNICIFTYRWKCIHCGDKES